MAQHPAQRRPVEVDHPVKRRLRSTVEPALGALRAGGAEAAAHIIGVSVSETTAETRIVTLKRDGELAEQAARRCRP